MSAARHLRAVDTNGQLVEDVTPVPSEVAALTQQLVDAQRKIAALKGQITRLRKVDPRASDIMDVLEHWRTVCKHPKADIPLDGKRAEYVAKMLAVPFTVEDIKQACDGVAKFPYEEYGQHYAEPGPKRKRRTDIPYICRDEVKLAQLRDLAVRDNGEDWYREWLWDLCQRVHFVPTVLAHLGKYEPSADVLLKAIVWARGQQGLETSWVDDELRGEEAA